MKWSIGTSASVIPPLASLDDPQLPPDHPPVPAGPSSPAAANRRPPSSCPMSDSARASSASSSRPGPAKCPVVHDTSAASSSSSQASGLAALNPLNMIPSGLSSTARAPGQTTDLPLDRETSTIPRPNKEADGDAHEGYWDYPSPQQFYNALVRKGWETPEDSIEMVVAIHNFLNERAWEEVMKWEKRLPGGEHAQLERFQGRPGELSPKARLHLWLSRFFPERFNSEPPFDRHDWIVTRPMSSSASPAAEAAPATSTSTSTTTANSESTTTTHTETTPTSRSTTTTVQGPDGTKTTTTRYVIDYYAAGSDADGHPIFSLDVRPALDSLEAVNQRLRVSLEEWMRGTEL